MQEVYSERRISKFLKPKVLFPFFDMQRDADYIMYRLYILSLKAIFVVAMLFLLDISMDTQLLFDDISDIPARGSQILSWIFALFSLVSYMRIRVEMDIHSADVPLFMNAALLGDTSKRKWIARAVFALLLMIVLLIDGYELVHPLARQFGVEGSATALVIIWAIFSVAIAIAPVIIVIYCLKMEKIIRSFDDFKRQLSVEARKQKK